jgi:hypothetical protein
MGEDAIHEERIVKRGKINGSCGEGIKKNKKKEKEKEKWMK